MAVGFDTGLKQHVNGQLDFVASGDHDMVLVARSVFFSIGMAVQ